jgi:tetratricopeptide (TPR) repeat protein
LTYVNKGLYDNAIKDYNKAIALDPSYSKAYHNRGYAYYMMGNLSEAAADLYKACDMGIEISCSARKALLQQR